MKQTSAETTKQEARILEAKDSNDEKTQNSAE